MEFLSELWHKYHQDHVSILVSSLAYYTFFSFFPLLLLVASILGILTGMGGEYAKFSSQLLGLLPFSSEYLQGSLVKILRARHSLGFFGTLLLIWSASAAFDILQQILNRIHHSPKMRPLWRRRLLGILLALILLLFIPLSVGFTSLRPVLAQGLIEHIPLTPRWEHAVVTVSQVGMGVLFNFILFLTLYSFGPSLRRRISRIWVGALVGAVLWEATKYIFAAYVKAYATYRMLYGTIGSVIALLLWLYVSGTLLALGAEVNSVLGMRRDRHPPATH